MGVIFKQKNKKKLIFVKISLGNSELKQNVSIATLKAKG